MYQIKNIQCEHMNMPLTVTTEKPRFSWEWDAEENNVIRVHTRSLYRRKTEPLSGTAKKQRAEIRRTSNMGDSRWNPDADISIRSRHGTRTEGK